MVNLKMKLIQKTTLLLAMASISGGGFAAEPTALDTLSVTTTRMAKPAKSLPNTVTIINAESLKKQTTINDSLAGILEKTVPGFAPSSQKMSGRAETLRGKNPLYMIDGIPQHNPMRDGSRDGYTIDTGFLERIEVIHGANAIQGVGATGGVIGMTTKSAKGNGEWNNEIKIGLTSNDKLGSEGLGHKLTYIGSIKKDQFDFVGGVAYQKRGMFYDANGDMVGIYPTQGDIMDSTSRDLFFKAGYNISNAQRIQLMINDFELAKNGDYKPVSGDRSVGKYATSEKGDPSATVGDPAKNDVTSISLDYRDSDLAGGELHTQLYFQDYAARFEGGTFVSSKTGKGFFRLTPNGAPYLDQSEIQSKKHALKVSYSKTDFANVEGLTPLIGLDYTSDTSNQSLVKSGRKWVPDVNFTTISPFVQFDYSVTDNIQLSAGIRHESASLNVDDYTTIAAYKSTDVGGGKPTFSETLKNIGAVYYVSDDLSVYASYSEGFDMADVGRVLRGIKTAGKDIDTFLDLEPVVTTNKEIGADFTNDKLQVHLAFYQSNTDLGARLSKNDSGIYEVKREKQAVKGWDITASYNFENDIVLGANYAEISGLYDSDSDGKTDTDLGGANIAPNKFMIFAESKLFGIDNMIQVSKLLDKEFTGKGTKKNGSNEFDGYTLVDFYLSKQTDFGQFSLGVENLLNENYETYFSQTESGQKDKQYFAGKGRAVTLTYQNNF